jgi:hypothetical protein
MSTSPRNTGAHHPHRTPLVAVRGLSETVAAGYGNAWLLVRTLDDVSLDLCGGDLLLLSGRVGEGAASLAGALAGRRRIMHGAREQHPGVRVRRGVISSGSYHAIIDGWSAGRATRCVGDDATGVRAAYILRVRHPSPRLADAGTPDSACDGHTRVARPADYPGGAWFGWARALCERGGAIVLWEIVARHGRSAAGGAVHERSEETVPRYGMWSGMGGPGDARADAECAGRLRAVRLVAGRLAPMITTASLAPTPQAWTEQGRP